ncbi:hypothetical protein [Janthinobacterium fluminis]|uniref:Bacteriocin-type signal sequence-containing protein n=1 Tax=Janthinobacterium fluminis TaxID=2987524 RepID=A0ABT5K0B1_9BURK|nr:hypothetical protein [Janthinobacterium fluminis]MDC8758166.1 hypothetical protein [Janthinobacterium fluminis]
MKNSKDKSSNSNETTRIFSRLVAHEIAPADLKQISGGRFAPLTTNSGAQPGELGSGMRDDN